MTALVSIDASCNIKRYARDSNGHMRMTHEAVLVVPINPGDKVSIDAEAIERFRHNPPDEFMVPGPAGGGSSPSPPPSGSPVAMRMVA